MLLKKPMDQWGDQEGNFKNTLRQMIMKTQSLKIYGMPQKQFWEGTSGISSKKKKTLKLPTYPTTSKKLREEKQKNLKSGEGRKS